MLRISTPDLTFHHVHSIVCQQTECQTNFQITKIGDMRVRIHKG